MSKLFLLAGLFVLASCSKDRIKGEGPTVTESRTASNFTSVNVSGSNEVFITKGPTFQVEVKGYQNLVPYFETEVRGNTLYLQFRSGTNVSNNNIDVFVTMPQLASVKNSGSSKTTVKGVFDSPRMEAYVSGSGKITLEDGTTDMLVQDVSGSGSIHAFGLLANQADVSISGSGSAEVNVAANLKAQVSGSGTVYYKGSPNIESLIYGSGKVVRRN